MRSSAPDGTTWARVVSNVLSPPVVLGALALEIARREASTPEQAALLVGVFVAFGILLPLIYVVLMVYRGKITDLHLPERRERYVPLFLSFVGAAIVLLGYVLLDAPRGLVLLAMFMLVANGIVAAITAVWQISVHGATIVGALTMASVLFGVQAALLFAPLVVLVGAARLSLRRHTPMELLAGMGLGALIVVVMTGLMLH